MATLKEKQLAFLNDTIQHYNSNNRCVIDSLCRYEPTTTSKGCAIGRHIPVELAKKLDNIKDKNSLTNSGVSNDKVFYKLPIKLQKLSKLFLVEIQILHDYDDYWDSSGLSKAGETRAEYIKREFGL